LVIGVSQQFGDKTIGFLTVVNVYNFSTTQTSMHSMFGGNAYSVAMIQHFFFTFFASATQLFPLRLRH